MNNTQAVPYFLQAMTPIHMGVGEGPRDINLPTARERVTNYPVVYGSSVKGVLRDYAAKKKDPLSTRELYSVFGPASERASEARGGVIFTDAQLLALPVRSMKTVFAWVTCPFVLRRLARDLSESGATSSRRLRQASLKLLQTPCPSDTALISEDSSELQEGENVMLEDYCFQKKSSADLDVWLKELADNFKLDEAFLKARFALVPDTIFGYFATYGTEIRTRVRIDNDTGTAAASGPWSEEYVPAETLLHGLIVGRDTVSYNHWEDSQKDEDESEPDEERADRNIQALRKVVTTPCVIRVGGKASVGMGRARLLLTEDIEGGKS